MDMDTLRQVREHVHFWEGHINVESRFKLFFGEQLPLILSARWFGRRSRQMAAIHTTLSF
jgi:hypothetical protein